MAASIMQIFYDVFGWASNMFTKIMTSSGMVDVYIGLVLVFLSVRLLLGPLFGVTGLSAHDAGSDIAGSAYSRWRNNRRISTSDKSDQSRSFARALDRVN